MSTAQTTRDIARELVESFANFELNSAKELREDALAHFQRLGFPGPRHEEYRFTPIARNLDAILSTNSQSTASDSSFEIKDYYIPGLSANYLVLINGHFRSDLSTIITPSNELSVMSLEQAVAEMPELVNLHLGHQVDYKSDGFAAYNTAFWKGGIFLYVPAGQKVQLPIVLIHLNNGTAQPVTATSRLLMLLGAGSEAQYIERFETKGTSFSSWVEEIVVEERAKFTYYKLQNDPGTTYQIASTLIHQSDGSRVDTFTLTLDGKMVRNNFGIAIDGERCESHFCGLYLVHKDTHADNHTVVDHRKPNSFSNQLYKGILTDSSKGIFNGKIYVRPHAQKTNAFQSNRNVLLTDTAVIHTKPQLEIWADDVKCSHGCTSGQLDDEALFYLQSRGISKGHAQALLLYAFAGEILDTVQNEIMKTYLTGIISNRLNQDN